MRKTLTFLFMWLALGVTGQNCVSTNVVCQDTAFEVCKNNYTESNTDGNDYALVLILTQAGAATVLQSSGDISGPTQACFTFDATTLALGDYEVHALNYSTVAPDVPAALPINMGDDINTIGATSAGCYNSDFLMDFVCYEVVSLPVASATCTPRLPGEGLIDINLMSGTNPDDVTYSLEGGAAQSSDAFTIDAVDTYTVTLTNTLTGCTYDVEISCMQLPIELTSFEGTCEDDIRALTWSTSSEQDVANFIIERSANGIDFTSIGEVAATGNSTTLQNYAFKDANGGASRYYYRLRIVETTGVQEFSRIIGVACLKGGLDVLDVHPNPANDAVMLTYETNNRNPLTIRLTDIFGRILTQEKLTPDIGLNTKNIDVSTLASSVYFIVLDDTKRQITRRIIVN